MHDSVSTIFCALAHLGPPTNITLYAFNSRSLSISWDIPADPEERHGDVVLTSIVCEAEGTQATITGFGIGIERSIILGGLSPHSNYNCCILLQTTLANSSAVCQNAQTPQDG